MTRLLPLALLAFSPACHLVLPLGGARDVPADGQADLWGDLVAPLDLTVGDSPGAAPCSKSCPPGDDCDGLPQARDPEPDLCNELLYQETFATDPLASSRWSTINGKWSWSSGWLEQTDTNNTDGTKRYFWARADDAKLAGKAPDARYLVEARFRLDAVGDAQNWEAGLVARLGDDVTGPDSLPVDHMICVARVDKVLNDCADCNPPQKIVNPDLRLDIVNSVGATVGWPRLNPPGLFDPSPGQIYIMQLWYRAKLPQVNCRLVDDGSAVKREATLELHGVDPKFQTYLPTDPGTVGFRTWKRAAGFDSIRVYRLHRPTS